MGSGTGTVVLRPSRVRFRPVWRYGLGTSAVLIGGVVVLATALAGGDVLHAVLGAAPLLVLVLLTLTYVAALDVRPRIVVTADSVVVRRLTRGRTTARSELGTAVLTTELDPLAGRISNPYASGVRLYLLRRDGTRVATLAEQYWGADRFAALTDALAVPVDHVGALTPKQLRQRHRGAVPWPAAHVATTTVLCVLALFPLGFAVLALVSLGTAVF